MEPRRGALSACVAGIGVLHAVTVVSVMVAIAAVGDWTFVGKLLLYAPRQPWLVTTALVAGALAWARRPQLLVLHAILAVVVAFPFMGTRVERSRTAYSGGTSAIRILTWNVFWGHFGVDPITEQVVAAGADVVVLQASQPSVTAGLARGLPTHSVLERGEFSLATKLPLLSAELAAPISEDEPLPLASFVVRTANGRSLRLLVVHPGSPRHALFDRRDARLDAEKRDRQFAHVAAAAERSSEPVVIIGDTNLPGWSVIARKRLGAFRDAFDEVGSGLGYTFPAKHPWMRIDRVLAGPGVRFLSVRVHPLGASDHRAVSVELEVP